jgi:methylmalonyl-CoA mutase
MLTRRDPWNNILRATLACFAAGVGGADAITVAPFDAAIGQPDQLARRVARNVHALLVDESHVAQVIDPAGGAWYVEDFTEQLAARAWAWFQDIERVGGLRAALASGFIASELAASRTARRDALARRREAVTGVSEFPLVGETLLSRPADHRPADHRPDRGAAGLPRIRWSQWHEELRDRCDAYARATGSPPTLTLAPLDAARASAARAAQVAALLAPAGIATVTVAAAAPGDAAAPDPAVPVIVVCGSPDADPDEVRAAVSSARARGTSMVVVAAGNPEAPAPGAAERIIDDMDVLTFSDRMLDALGVPK